jgi:hypothetical protein
MVLNRQQRQVLLMKKIKQAFNNSPWIFTYSVAMVVAVILAAIFFPNRKVWDQQYSEYVRDHNCIRTGFAGPENNEPVYRCNDGVWLSNEIWDRTKPKS